MKNSKVRIAQAGITNHGATILEAIQAADSLELASAYDVKTSDSTSVAKKLGIRHAKDYDDLINDPSIEAVALVTPNHLHAAQVTKAVQAGKHVFVEKPIANTVAEAREMVARMRDAGLVLMVGHNTRRRTVFRRAKTILDEQRLGKVVAVEMNVSRPAGLQPGLPPWKADPKTTALLPMTQLGVHFVDTLHYLLGPIARVGCLASNMAMSGGALDVSAAVLQLESGVTVSLSSYYVTPDVYVLRVYGTKGILHCYNTRLKLELLENDILKPMLEEDFSSEGSASFAEEMEEFGQCVLKKRKPETGGEEGLRALAVIEAMVQSLNSRRMIDIKDIL